MASCEGSAGYKGYLTACGKLLPYLTAELTKVTEILPSGSVHGAGNSTNPVFRSQHNFALGRTTVEGSISCEVFAGSGEYAVAFTNMLQRAIPSASDDSLVCDGFSTSCKLILSPGGGSEIVLPDITASNPKALIKSLELRGNNGGIVGATFGIVSAGATYNEAAANTPTTANLSFEPVQAADDSNPLPYWASTFSPTGTGETNITTTLADQITDWTITINNNTIPVYTFNGEQFAQDIVLGQLQVSGTFKYYSPNGKFVEKLSNGAAITMTFGSTTITLPYIAFGACPIPGPGPQNLTERSVNFTGFAKSASLPSIYYS